MFPDLGYLWRWLTGWNLHLPIPTFGCCMALSFWAAYIVFTLEFRRKSHRRPSQEGTSSPTAAIPPGIRISPLMDRLLLFCGLIGFAGALLLAKLDDTYGLWHHPGKWLTRYHGLTYFGGLLFGIATYLIILCRKGISLSTALDIGSPGMMLAYAIGRMGCHLAGDGDWGIVNRLPKPDWLAWMPHWFWAARYPHNVIRQGVYIPGCHLDYCTVLPEAVFPTSLYESLVCLLLFFLLWAIRRRLTLPGLLFCIYAMLTGIERFFVEYIRVTPKHSVFGWELTQAQFISLAFIAVGLAGTGYILTSSAKKAYFYL